MNTSTDPTFYLSLLEFMLAAKQHVVAVGGEFGLTAMQTMTLLLINEQSPRPMNSFCKLYNCDASNITGIVDGLEQKGLVSRQENPKDRRVKVLCLEKAGQKLQTEVIERLAASSGFLFDPLTPDEAKQFRAIIEKLAQQTMLNGCPFEKLALS